MSITVKGISRDQETLLYLNLSDIWAKHECNLFLVQETHIGPNLGYLVYSWSLKTTS
jgi:hypothetical protein